MSLNRSCIFSIKTTVMRIIIIIPTSSPLKPTPLTFLYHHSAKIMKTNRYLDKSELLIALQSCNSKSPEPDNIPYIFIKNLPQLGLKILLQIYNIIWTQGIFPNQSRNANIIPIPKPNKSKFDIENYRPISLISTLSKLIEKIINKRLIWTLESSKLISKEQCGFRKNHSTIDALSTLHTDICSAFRRNQHLSTIALDISKAYDSVWKKRKYSTLGKLTTTSSTL